VKASNGWAGRILEVDLTNRRVETSPLPSEWAEKYMGGKGFGARILYDEVGPEVDALSPGSVIIIASGLLDGTFAPASSRCEVIAKSPMTGIYGRSNVGHGFGAEMKWAGYDLIVIRGESERPVYLWIWDDHVEIKDARHLWGKSVWNARLAICDEHRTRAGDKGFLSEIATLLIGPAGENLSLASCVMSGFAKAAGTCSIGAVWGSKKLKGVAIRGSKGVHVAEPEKFMGVCNTLCKRFETDPLYKSIREWGTMGWVGGSYSRSPAGKALSGGERNEAIEESGFEPLIEKHLACYGCPLHCSHFYNVKEGKYKGTRGKGLEGFVQIFALSFKTPSAPFLCKFNNLCNELGLNVSSVGPAVIWALELWKAGTITKADTDGIEVTEGNEEAILELTRKMAYREGFGEILADYPIRGAQKLGRNSDQYAAHTKGLQTWGVGPGIGTTLIYTLALNVATRGFDHLTGGPSIYTPNFREEFGITKELLAKLGEERYGDPEIFLNPWAMDLNKARIVYDFEHLCGLVDMVGICKFATWYDLPVAGINIQDIGDLCRTATGVAFDTEDLVKAAKRVFAIERAYNAREGIRRIDDYPFFIWWQLKYGQPNPAFANRQIPVRKEDYDVLLDEYYTLRGCDLKTGIPTVSTLKELGLQDIALDLQNRKILPG
jgi:aldehyde:ferredoxin oxidoreductase